jgi:hypothetical protein
MALIKNQSSRLSVLVLSMALLAVSIVFGLKWAECVSLGTGICGIVSSRLSRYIEKGMLAVTKIMGYAVQTVLLAILFYLILFPVSLLYRLFNKDYLMLSSKYNSYFVDIKKDFEKDSFEKPW